MKHVKYISKHDSATKFRAMINEQRSECDMRYLITVDCNRIYMDIGSLNFRGDFLSPAFVRARRLL